MRAEPARAITQEGREQKPRKSPPQKKNCSSPKKVKNFSNYGNLRKAKGGLFPNQIHDLPQMGVNILPWEVTPKKKKHGIIFSKNPIRRFHFGPTSQGNVGIVNNESIFFGTSLEQLSKYIIYTHVKNNCYGTFTLVVKSMLNVNLGGILGGTQC